MICIYLPCQCFNIIYDTSDPGTVTVNRYTSSADILYKHKNTNFKKYKGNLIFRNLQYLSSVKYDMV